MKRISMIIAIIAVVTGISAYAFLGDAISGATSAVGSAARSVAAAPSRLINRDGRPANLHARQEARQQARQEVQAAKQANVQNQQAPVAAQKADMGRRPFAQNQTPAQSVKNKIGVSPRTGLNAPRGMGPKAMGPKSVGLAK